MWSNTNKGDWLMFSENGDEGYCTGGLRNELPKTNQPLFYSSPPNNLNEGGNY